VQANAAYEAYRARGRMKDGRRFAALRFVPSPTQQRKANLTIDFWLP
jgi:hypothetical protein